MTQTLDMAHRSHPDRRTKLAPTGRVEAVTAAPVDGDHEALGKAIAEVVTGEVRFDRGSRALYATDASNYRQVPIGVVLPRSSDEVERTVELCRQHGAPIVLRGGGTSLAGQGCNVAVLIDMSKYMHDIVSLDYEARRAIVQPGCVLDHLRDAAERQHLTFGPDPATHDHNTLGGMLGNNSCGVHSIMGGRTSDNVESLEILTYDGLRMTVGATSEAELAAILAEGGRKAEIYRALVDFRDRYRDLILDKYPRIPRRVSGYENLEQLLPENGFNVARVLVGTEATCVTILEAKLQLIPSPPERTIAILGFDDVFAAADAVPWVLEHGPIACEGMDHLLVEFVLKKHLHPDDLSVLPDGKGWLIVEFGGQTRDEAMAKAHKLGERHEKDRTRVLDDREQQKRIWEVRDAALGATAHVPGKPETYPGWEDSAVHRDNLGKYLRELKQLFDKYGYEASVYGHFGDGLVHCRVPFDLRTETGVAAWRSFLDEAAALVVRYDGTLSGEHGDGQARAELLEKMYGPDLVRAFAEFKAIWDPQGRMNPGKVVEPYPITSNLRYGPAYRPRDPETYFAFGDDDGSFVKATRRCVGVGACRRRDSSKSVMCPSYMVTNEEKYSTRGRARLLFEMLHGGAIEDRWQSDEVEDALDLCLACKGCKSDCPVSTDMATYKAEFRAHYYEHRLRPRAAYSMGLIAEWSKLGGNVPWLANLMLQTPGLSSLAKAVGGIAQQRRMPRYAPQPATRLLSAHARPADGDLSRTVMLWPDTFNNFFRPQTAVAAKRVLEWLGYTVLLPQGSVCCGRPLYDWGMLEKARRTWERSIEAMTPAIRLGIPVVGLEPACVSAFRDELPNLMHGNERAGQLSNQVVFFTEFLERHPDNAALPKIAGSALVQMHCHHHAVINTTAEEKVLRRLGLDFEVMASGCCGMAGSFGFEADKYEVSMRAAERVLLPTVRAAKPETILLANGFSCREQIEQGSQRRTRHIAELIADNLPART